MDKLKICYVECELIWEDPKSNRDRIENWLIQEKEDCDLIILPEMFTTGFTMIPQQIAEAFHSEMETLLWMKRISKLKSVVLMGSIPVSENGKYYNRMLIAFPDGSFQYYDKIRLFSLTNENIEYSPGDSQIIFNYKNWNVLPQICYDLRFPESARNKIKTGNPSYDLLVYSANWPKTRIDQWKSLLRARAIENQCFAIGVNRIGTDENGLEYNGNSVAYDFKGDKMAVSKGKSKEIYYLKLNKIELKGYQKSFPFLWDQ